MRYQVVSGGRVDGIGGDLVVADRSARAEDELAQVMLLAAAVGEDALEGTPTGLPDALAGRDQTLWLERSATT